MRIRAMLVVLTLGSAGQTEAQGAYYSIRPALFENRDLSVGARWEAGFESQRSANLALAFPRERWWSVQGQGAWFSQEGANPEPLVRAQGDGGILVLLLRQRPCLPNNCPDDLTDFDFGYISAGLRVEAETDQAFDEAQVGAGGAITYRPLGLQSGVWPLVPTLSVEYEAVSPVESSLRDALALDDDLHGKLGIEAIWHVLFARSGVPTFLQPGRLDVNLAHFRQHGLEDALEAAVGSNGTFVAVDLGYEFTQRVPWLRHAFIRWSEGEHPVIPVGRKGWMLGIVLGKTRD